MQYCYDFTRIKICENNMDVFISLFNIIKQLSNALQVNGSNYSSSGMTIDPKRETIDLDFVSVNSFPFRVNSHSLGRIV
jgi:hypothetical protein